jgi:hypothetical protein
MARHRSHRRRSHSRVRTQRMAQHGGELAGNPPSAWGWGLGTVGSGWQQFMNSLTLQPGQNLGAQQSNDIVPTNNLNAQTVPQGGGRRRHRSRARRGGNWASVASQAAVPAALIFMNNAIGKQSKRHSRRR